MSLGDSAVLVVSDSHGYVPALTAVLRWAAGTAAVDGAGVAPAFSAAVFLGDGAGDIDAASAETGFTLPWYKVRGNGDLDLSIPGSMVLEIPTGPGGPVRRLFLAHGNRHGVEEGVETIAAAARSAGAEAALFGHTHVPSCDTVDGILALNPGSVSRPRSRIGPTFAVLECPAGGPLEAWFYGLYPRGRHVALRKLKQ
jgi:putative phosphoesterase